MFVYKLMYLAILGLIQYVFHRLNYITMKLLLIISLITSGWFIVKHDPSSSNANDSEILAKASFSHVVLFYLKHPGNQAERQQFETSLNTFIKNSQHVKSIHLGTPASSDRAVVDKSYTYMMVLTFASSEEQDKYQEEVGHKKFIEESEHLWQKVVVYDSENMW